jgi:hypothetical protein
MSQTLLHKMQLSSREKNQIILIYQVVRDVKIQLASFFWKILFGQVLQVDWDFRN